MATLQKVTISDKKEIFKYPVSWIQPPDNGQRIPEQRSAPRTFPRDYEININMKDMENGNLFAL